jgi:hypothetical protein
MNKTQFKTIEKDGIVTVIRGGQQVGWIQRSGDRSLYRALTASGVVYHCNSKDTAFERIMSEYR